MSGNLRLRYVLASVFAGALAFGPLVSSARAQTYTPLVNFSTNPKGNGIANPVSQLVTQGEDGEMYFTSVNGGFYGTIFKVSPEGAAKIVNPVGYYPNGGATLGTDGYFYGVTINQSGPGTIWKVSKAGKETIIYTFTGNGDGKNPISSPIEGSNGLFYGTAPYGGANNYSTAYSVTSTGAFTLLHTFNPTTEGQQVQANLVQGTDGNFYGTAPYGGANGDGTIFKMTPSGTVTVLHNFSGPDGQTPWYGLVQASDGNFYGTTFNGGVYGAQGVIFKITPSGEYTVLHNVVAANGDGKGPGSVLTIGTDGKLYGVTASGNSGFSGTIFSITTEGTFETLYTLCKSGTCTDGYGPQSAIEQNTNGIFYGTTSNGGDLSCGNAIGCGNAYSLDMGLQPFAKLLTTSGAEGGRVGIFGQGFDATTTVEFGGTKAAKVTRSGSTFITATVPPGALTGAVTITTGSSTLTARQSFNVLPAVKSLSPTSGNVGSDVTILGSGFDQTESVSFNGAGTATFTVVSDTEITATVPASAETGNVTITTKGGVAISKTVFKVK